MWPCRVDTTPYYAKGEIAASINPTIVYCDTLWEANEKQMRSPAPTHFSVDTVIKKLYDTTLVWIPAEDFRYDTLYDTTWVFPVEE